ncbi:MULTISPECIES: hypothetical protein [unclassified Streptomyces]|uniref:hypothetical protein n=1 Tax=unclassified Streptomyces TaxID=2593676 RepID=UPI0022B6A61D|nr:MULTISPECIES: hypothetical protein [unclassified Streptomyces]MCZ7413817.1 hypothetical protein [Streptomyces sp. WMMC897]MCZ7430813.1 hypothetical protein [Streptomyces sp. WMMC1477]
MKRSPLRKLVLAAGATGAAAATVLAVRAAGLGPPESTPVSPGGTSTSEVQPGPSDVERYWTQERMAEAEPAPMPRDG